MAPLRRVRQRPQALLGLGHALFELEASAPLNGLFEQTTSLSDIAGQTSNAGKVAQ